jgi:UDP-N-acetylglucosamine diphosphorylase/glucosamine-1-phosphate N-acetyltransferase
MPYILKEEFFENFFPLSLSHHVFELKVGAFSNYERLVNFTKDDIFCLVSNKLIPKEYKKYEGNDPDALVLVSNFIIEEDFINKILQNISKKLVIKSGNKIIGYSYSLIDSDLKADVNVMNTEVRIIEKVYDLIKYNKEILYRDVLSLSRICNELKFSYNKIGKYPLITDGDIYLEPNVIFDLREGPVFIGDGAYIQGNTRIEGPSYIGKNTLVITNSNIRRSSIGNNCTIGGEVTNSIILDYTNSRHNSYIGDSYLGEWINIGALSVVSNLKNTYGIIKYDNLYTKEETRMKKLGVILGDHVKVSIGSLLFGGKSAGFSSHIYFTLNKSIPSFTLWNGEKNEGYEFLFESSIEVAKRYMQSKKVEFTEYHYKLFKNIFEYTAKDREKLGIKRGRFNLES